MGPSRHRSISDRKRGSWGEALLHDPIALACLHRQVRTALHDRADRVILARHAALRLECEDVLPMHLLADQADRVFEAALLEEAHRPSAGVARKQLGEVGLLQPEELAEPVDE